MGEPIEPTEADIRAAFKEAGVPYHENWRDWLLPHVQDFVTTLARRIAAEREAVVVAWQYKRKDFAPAVSAREQDYADLQWQKPLYAHPPEEPTT